MFALENVKVLDLAHLVPGSFCTMILGDFGADILKIEAPPQVGGRGAGLGAGLGISPLGEQGRRLAAFDALNRNKKSMGLNLRSKQGCEIFFKIAKDADVIVEGFRPGVVKRLGVDYEAVKKINPGIVYCSLSGYGQDGPYSALPGHDINYISIAGVLGMIGKAGEPPTIPLNLAADFAGASLHGVIGILLALLAREKTGKGQYIDIAYADGALSLITMFIRDYFSSGVVIERGESVVGGSYPYYGVYQTKDNKYLTIGCIEPWFWVNLCRALGKEEYSAFTMAPEHFYQKPTGDKWQEIFAYLRKTFLTRTRDEWFDFLIKQDVPVGKVLSLDEVPNDPQVKHRKMVIEIDDPKVGKVKQAGIAIKLSETPGKVRKLAPIFGENTEEILQGLGYTKAQIEELRQAQAIG